MAGRGRPTKYKVEFAAQAEKLCKLGSTDAEMADFFEVAESQINAWKIAHPEFQESIKKGKTLADANVADRLYQRAMGYSHDAEKIMTVSVGGGESVVTREPYIEHYPPDTTAAIFWLKNRQRVKWRDKQDHEVTGANGAPLVPVLNVTIGRRSN